MTLFIDPPTMTYPVDAQFLRDKYPDTSFPNYPDDETYLAHGCEIVEEVPPPEPLDGYTVVEGPPTRVDEVWKQTWTFEKIPAPDATPVVQKSAQSLQMSNAKRLAAQGRTDEAVVALIAIIEQQQ